MGTRRVYRPELKQRLGYRDTWFRLQRKAGRIKPGHVDPGGRREWWTDAEADEIIAELTATAEQAAA